MNNIYVIGDIHGEIHKLIECLELVNFNYENDTLISLGDIVDRGYSSFECIELLMKCKKGIFIRGNHDDCWFNYLKTGKQDVLWNQGGKETYFSYYNHDVNPEVHFKFFADQVPYYVDENNNLFVHGGFNRHYLITEQFDINNLYWDRDLLVSAKSYDSMKDKIYPFKTKNNFKEIFLGHTPVQYFENTNKPLKFANITLLDTGCGKGDFPLTIMNLVTRELFQSKL